MEEDESLFTMTRFDPTSRAAEAEATGEEGAGGRLQDINNRINHKRKAEVKPDKDTSIVPAKKRKKNKKKSKKAGGGVGEVEGFTILGDPTDRAVKKVTRVLPYWLANPDVVTVDLDSASMPAAEMVGLQPALVNRLAGEGITHLFPVQRQVLPRLLNPHPRYRPSDLCVAAPTGSGKTLAFVLPVVQALAGRLVPRVRCVAVLPTQDLASQVHSVFVKYGGPAGLRARLLTGGEAGAGAGLLVRVGPGGVMHQLADILVVTPGRLVATLRSCPQLDLSHLRYLIIDEADRMMENIAQDWLAALEAAVYTGGRARPGPLTAAAAAIPAIPLQKLLFSATLSQDPQQLEQLNLFEPKLFRCLVAGEAAAAAGPGRASLPASLTQLYTVCSTADKPAVTVELVGQLGLGRALVFTQSNDTAHRLALLLTALGHKAGELSSAVKGRRKVLAGLARGNTTILVCSDVVARGIDLDCCDGVINYDVPSFGQTYIHRVGRTARAGRLGTALTICEDNQTKSFLKMLKDSEISGCELVELKEGRLAESRQLCTTALEQVKTKLEQERGDGSGRMKAAAEKEFPLEK